MLSTHEFLNHALTLAPGASRVTSLRVVLNALFDADQYPVDLTELLALPERDRALAFAFLSSCAAHPGEHTSWPSWALRNLCLELDSMESGAEAEATP